MLAPVVDPRRLQDLRRTLYQVTPLRAEDTDPRDPEAQGWFVDVFAAAGDLDDPILELAERIAWSDRAVTLGLTGGTGVGKTTQIRRLQRVLWDDHLIKCVALDYGEFSELSSPPDITDFLLSLVGGFALQAVRDGLLPTGWDDDSIGGRLLEILKRLKVPELEVAAGPATVRVQDLLRQDETFRRRLREHMSGRVSEIIQEARTYAGEIASAIGQNVPDCAGVAMVVDSTEKLAAPGSEHDRMQAAVRNLFIQNGVNLTFPEVHTVYLVPPWLPISDGGAVRLPLIQFPAVRVEKRAGGGPDEDGIDIMERIVLARMPDVHELIAPDDLRRLCLESGGVQRVLFQMLHAAAGKARNADSLPIDSRFVDAAVDTVREDYLAVTVEAAPWLATIQETSTIDGLPADALAALGGYFQAMVVLQFSNGTKWYAIHPLMRKRVERAQAATT